MLKFRHFQLHSVIYGDTAIGPSSNLRILCETPGVPPDVNPAVTFVDNLSAHPRLTTRLVS